MTDLSDINKNDPIKRMVERQTEQEEFSPMDPPEAYSPPQLEKVDPEAMHPFLQELVEEHKECVKALNSFEEALLQIQSKGSDPEVDQKLREFFQFFDSAIVMHNRKEDRILFPLLHERLLAHGEHSKGPDALTAVDVLEDEHGQILQLTTVAFNLFRLVMQLPDPDSRLILMDAAIEQGKKLIELLRLHIFREDNIVFVQAHKFISTAEFDEMEKRRAARSR